MQKAVAWSHVTFDGRVEEPVNERRHAVPFGSEPLFERAKSQQVNLARSQALGGHRHRLCEVLSVHGRVTHAVGQSSFGRYRQQV